MMWASMKTFHCIEMAPVDRKVEVLQLFDAYRSQAVLRSYLNSALILYPRDLSVDSMRHFGRVGTMYRVGAESELKTWHQH
jgi:hypothetical protein